jgi:penicillin-binding protein 1A
MTGTSADSSFLDKTMAFLSGVAASFGRFLFGPIFRWMLVGVGALGIIFTFAMSAYVYSLSRDLPSVQVLAEYKPPVTTRVHAGDGRLIAEFASEHRIYVPYEGMPEHLIQAFVSAEDKSFFTHDGIDYSGLMRAGVRNVLNKLRGRGGNLQGGSTITQQVAKNMLLNDGSQEIERKIREAILAKRMEKVFSKEEIIELYMNEIYLGGSSYGVASAALNYFNKSLPDLSLEEAAVLAAMAQRPGDVNPFRKPERSKVRRDWVIERMRVNGFISRSVEKDAQSMPLLTRERLKGEEYAAATYFVEELRRDLAAQLGEEELKADGLSIRSTLDTRLQLAAQNALREGLENYDRRKGYRGPITHIEPGDGQLEALNDVELPGGYGTREAAMVLSASNNEVKLLLTDGFEINLKADDVEWSRTYRPEIGERGLTAGDVVMVGVEREEKTVEEGSEEPNPAGDPVETQATSTGGDGTEESEEPEIVNAPVGEASLGQIPEVEGALLALDPHTGRILAMAGGYSFWKNQFNRTTQAKRQPGSSFKPFVYASAMELGDPRTGLPAYTPASKILDAPFVQCDYTRVGEDPCYKPTNYTSGRFYGMSTMRLGLEKSRNAMTVRLANDIGMEQVSTFANRIGLYEDLPPYLSMALGAGEVSVWDMAQAYATLVNGGKKVNPSLFDRVQDRDGQTIYKTDDRECEGCSDEYEGQVPNLLPDTREQVVDPIVAFQTAFMLQGVVDRGTAAGLRRDCPRGELSEEEAAEVPPVCTHVLAGKTGTTNDYIDAWFMGFSPDLVVGVYVGFDEPKSLGNAESGGRVAAPIFGSFMNEALKGYEAIPFRAPSGIRFVDIDARTGELPGPGTTTIIREAFRKGTEPGFDSLFEDDDYGLYGPSTDNGDDFSNFGGTTFGQSDDSPGVPGDENTQAPSEEVEEDFDAGIY